MEMEPKNVEEVEKSEEIDKKLDPDLSVNKEDDKEESVGRLNVTCVSALDTILESLWHITVFTNHLANSEKAHYNLTEDETNLRVYLLNDLSLIHPMEPNGVFDLFLNILGSVPQWDSHFEMNQVAKKICNRCRMDIEYPDVRHFGLIINATSFREFKAAFEMFTFEKIIKIMRMNIKMPCNKEGCGKENYVECLIKKLPTVLTIALEWENDETEAEIFETTSVLATEIDISGIYRYEGDSLNTKYGLVSMVCSHEDGYNCLAIVKNRWVRYFGSEVEEIGDWKSVISTFRKLNMRPEILFYENVMKRDQFFGSKK